jgi:hypothetical protein
VGRDAAGKGGAERGKPVPAAWLSCAKRGRARLKLAAKPIDLAR